MKRTIAFLLMILFIGTGCGQRQSGNDDLVLVDITKTPSSKKELILQDFMDVEYIALETNDEFVNQGFVQAIGEKNILVRNYKDDGDIFVYDRKGKAVRKINRKGQDGEEYTVYNGDYTIKEEIYMNSFRPVNHEIESWRSLESYRLILSYEKDQLKGKLKEIAATLDEDSNPVIMLVKHR